jgi:DNA repair exonuclease SbcCD nuclease subunit
MKIALITDQHFGARSDSPVFHDYFEKFYTEFFFPYIKENNIYTVIDLGDTFDRRKYISYYSLFRAKKYWFNNIKENRINLISIVGNHVIPYKNTLSINALDLLLKEYYPTVITVSEPKEFEFPSSPDNVDRIRILMLPWICDDNREQTMQMIEETKAQFCFGHLELGGFEMYKGSLIFDGMDARLFEKFEMVCSGHYHHKSTRGNINYLGCPYEMTWSDYDDPKGFHIFDTETRSLTFIENPYRMFHKIFYDDSVTNLAQIMDKDYTEYKNTHIKVVVKSKNNPYWFDLFIDKLEKAEVVNIQVVDDHLNLDIEDDDDIINEAEDTITILKKYVENLEIETDKQALETLLRSLYEESLSVE